MDRLDEIEARFSEATPGPLRVGERPNGHKVLLAPHQGGKDGCTTAHVFCEFDAAFFAHAREDVPWLVEEVRRLRAEVAELQVELAQQEALLGMGRGK